jgi:hypothetical protein
MPGISVPAALRETEGTRKTGAVARTRNLSGEKRGRGRPVGAKNKSKSLVPVELADELLIKMQGMLPPEHYEYLKAVVKRGDTVSTEKELDILILLLGRNLHPALIEETGNTTSDPDDPDAPGTTVFRRDVTERLKVLNSLLTLRHQVEKNKDDGKGGTAPLLTIVADRNLLDGGRMGILLGGVPGPMVGDSDGVGRPAIPPRAVSG